MHWRRRHRKYLRRKRFREFSTFPLESVGPVGYKFLTMNEQPTKPTTAELASRIRAWRAYRDFTLDDMTTKTSMTAPFLSRAEHAKVELSDSQIGWIANAFGITVHALVYEPFPPFTQEATAP